MSILLNVPLIQMQTGETSPPNLLTEADLITLMEKHGIGTDATHAEHIEKIQTRSYVGVQDSKFIPGRLGMGLVEGALFCYIIIIITINTGCVYSELV